MARYVEFRGLRVDGGGWVYGFYAFEPFNDTGAVILEVTDSVYDNQSALAEVQVAPETVGQYTGLKDKNGVKIFEGDTVEMIYRDGARESGIVEYCDNKARYLFFSCEEDGGSYGFDGTTPCEVTGNIHQNPELFEANNGKE